MNSLYWFGILIFLFTQPIRSWAVNSPIHKVVCVYMPLVSKTGKAISIKRLISEENIDRIILSDSIQLALLDSICMVFKCKEEVPYNENVRVVCILYRKDNTADTLALQEGGIILKYKSNYYLGNSSILRWLGNVLPPSVKDRADYFFTADVCDGIECDAEKK